MKIRTGFVSNSSSSSYVLKIHNISEEEFFNTAYDQLQDYNEPEPKDHKRYVIEQLTDLCGWCHQKSVNVGNNEVTIVGFTSMHNSYRDMPPVMSQLYFRFLQDMKMMSFKRQDDY